MELEQCNCEQALYYKKLSRKLAHTIMKYCTHENQEKYSTVHYSAEKIAPLARQVLKEIK